jgi:hypothetical protein
MTSCTPNLVRRQRKDLARRRPMAQGFGVDGEHLRRRFLRRQRSAVLALQDRDCLRERAIEMLRVYQTPI